MPPYRYDIIYKCGDVLTLQTITMSMRCHCRRCYGVAVDAAVVVSLYKDLDNSIYNNITTFTTTSHQYLQRHHNNTYNDITITPTTTSQQYLQRHHNNAYNDITTTLTTTPQQHLQRHHNNAYNDITTTFTITSQ